MKHKRTIQKTLTFAFILSLSNIFSQDLWKSFPKESTLQISASLMPSGKIFVSSSDNGGVRNYTIKVTPGEIVCDGSVDFTFDSRNPVLYNSGESVYYLGEEIRTGKSSKFILK